MTAISPMLFETLQRAAGPVLVKEMQITSRRRRLYLLRFAYIGALVLLVVRLWYSLPHTGGSSAAVVQTSRLGEMGKQIVALVVWFQFITGQLLAAVLLSDAIGSEIRQRTLDALLVTPVRSLQIVLGKLFSKLLQLVSLLAVSLPVLAVVRAFGGVSWEYVVAGLCVTLSAGVFAGSLSLMCSISNRHPYHAVLTVGLWYLVVWALVPMVLVPLSLTQYAARAVVQSILHYTNPFMAMGELTRGLVSGTGRVRAPLFWHCLILLASAVVLLGWSVWRVRRIALRAVPRKVSEPADDATPRSRKRWGQEAIRPVVGAPIVWKERCTPLFRTRGRGLFFAGLLIVIVGGVVTLYLMEGEGIHVMALLLIQLLQLLFVIDLAVAAASAVTKEREARTWPVLLMTPLEAGEIIKGKAIGIFRRNLPLLLPLPVLYFLMLVSSPAEQSGSWQLVLAAGWMVVSLVGASFLLLGTGLYFSTRLKTTTAAVAATFSVYLAPKFLCCGFFNPILGASTGIMGLMMGRSGGPSPLAAVMVALAPAGIYLGVGLLFMRLAVRRVRRDVF